MHAGVAARERQRPQGPTTSRPAVATGAARDRPPRTASGGGPDAAGFDQNLIVWVNDTMRPRPAQ